MGYQDYKRKFFYDSSKQKIKDLLDFAEEEEPKNEHFESSKKDMDAFLSMIGENIKVPAIFLEDNGVIYGLTESLYFYNKLHKIH